MDTDTLFQLLVLFASSCIVASVTLVVQGFINRRKRVWALVYPEKDGVTVRNFDTLDEAGFYARTRSLSHGFILEARRDATLYFIGNYVVLKD